MAAFQQRSGGFTLIEIMIVVGIIAMLAAMAIGSFAVARRNSRNLAFVNDITKACNAFELYSIENGGYPADESPAIVPDGMAEYLPKMDWTAETPIGGQWDWDNGQFGHTAGVSVFRPNRSRSRMVEIDRLLDDGDLRTGLFRRRAQGYIYIIERGEAGPHAFR